MKPVDFRNATFADLRERIAGQREAVLNAWRMHGPGTTEEVAQRAGISILSFRPRTTELYQLGFIACVDEEPSTSTSDFNSCAARDSRGARYRARTAEEHTAWFAEQTQLARDPQRELSLGV